MSMQQRPLTQRQENFVRKVAEGMAASRAYRDAGFAASSGNSAEVLASRTLRKVQVAARLAELRAEQAKRHEVTIDSLDPLRMSGLNSPQKRSPPGSSPARQTGTADGKMSRMASSIRAPSPSFRVPASPKPSCGTARYSDFNSH
jgi:hypothetical protein